MHADLRPAAQARRPCVRAAAPAKASRRRADVCESSKLEPKPSDFDAQPRAMRIHRRVSPERRVRGACFSGHPRAMLRPARAQVRTRPAASRARPWCLRRARHDGMRPRRALPKPAAFQPPQAGGAAPRRAQSGARQAFRGQGWCFRPPLSAPGCPQARGALGLDQRSPRRLDPQAPHRDPSDHELMGGPQSRRQGRGIELRQRALGLLEATDQKKTPNLEMPRVRGVRRSPCRSSAARAASSDFAGRQVARDESNLSLGDNTPARGLPRSFGPKARPAFRSRAFARTRSPSCAIAIPRTARAGASLRKATHFNAPSGSPVASACAAAVISESTGIPSNLSLSPLNVGSYSTYNNQQIRRREKATVMVDWIVYPNDFYSRGRVDCSHCDCACHRAGESTTLGDAEEQGLQ